MSRPDIPLTVHQAQVDRGPTLDVKYVYIKNDTKHMVTFSHLAQNAKTPHLIRVIKNIPIFGCITCHHCIMFGRKHFSKSICFEANMFYIFTRLICGRLSEVTTTTEQFGLLSFKDSFVVENVTHWKQHYTANKKLAEFYV